ncbi:MAG: urease accessory protein UreD [Proteobacteria bacterium]|nr:MAG: urease accessory protein UreD [Pseudomonadota bacterium]
MTIISEIPPVRVAARRWPASLRVEVAAIRGVTRVVGRRQRGPLTMQRPLYPEGGIAHLVILHPPGGVVGGDSLDIRLCGNSGARCLVTTPGATKFYRSNGSLAIQRQRIVLGDATLEWFPQENILFDGSDAPVRTDLEIGDGGRLIAWEINCFGRPAAGERFSSGRVGGDVRVAKAGRELLVERYCLWPSSNRGVGAAGLRGHSVQASMLALPADGAAVDAAREVTSGVDFPCAVSLLDDLLVLRALASDARRVRSALATVWRRLRPMIAGRPATEPRIWRT